MNITLESLQQEIAKYQEIIGKYRTNPEYVNPNCPLDTAIEIVDRLTRRILSKYQKDMIIITESMMYLWIAMIIGCGVFYLCNKILK